MSGISSTCSIIELKQRLLKLNEHPENPFILREDGDDIVAVWNIVDAQWGLVTGLGGLKDKFELRLIFDETNQRVYYQEYSASSEWEANTDKIKFEKHYEFGPRKEMKFGASWGERRDGSLGEIYHYSFNTTKITGPVFDIVKKSGWKIKVSFFRRLMIFRKKKMFCWLVAIFLILAAIVSVHFMLAYSIKSTAYDEIDLLRNGNISVAYQATDSSMKKKMTLEEFQQYVMVKRFREIKDYNFIITDMEDNVITLTGDATFNDNSVHHLYITVSNNPGDRKVLSINLL